jgi:hypothetical protein
MTVVERCLREHSPGCSAAARYLWAMLLARIYEVLVSA